MAKRSNRRKAARSDRESDGCVWGMIRMLYFRRHHKFLLNSHEGDNQDTTARRSSRDRVNNVREMEENSSRCNRKTRNSVKKLLNAELDRANPLKKIPAEEVEKILSDLGHEVCLQTDSEKTNSEPPITSELKGSNMASIVPASVNFSYTGDIHTTEERNLRTLLADFLLEIYQCHTNCSQTDCHSNETVCPTLELLLQAKLSELDGSRSQLYPNPIHTLTDATETVTNDSLAMHQHSNNLTRPKEFTDALELLVSNKELFLRLLQRLDFHLLEGLHQNITVTNVQGPLAERNEPAEEPACSSYQNEDPTKSLHKDGRAIFFWKRGKESKKQISEGIGNDPKLISRIVILKPNFLVREHNQSAVACPSSSNQHQQTSEDLELDRKASSGFSFSEIRRRLRLVSVQTQKDRSASSENVLQKEPSSDSLVDAKDDEQSKNITWDGSSCNRRIRRRSGSFSYEEAKKHLSDIIEEEKLNDTAHADRESKTLAVILSTPECGLISPNASPREDEGLAEILDEEQMFSAKGYDKDNEIANCQFQNSESVTGNVQITDGKCSSEYECYRVQENPMEEIMSEGGVAAKALESDHQCMESSSQTEQSSESCEEYDAPQETGRDDILLEISEEQIPEYKAELCSSGSPGNAADNPECFDHEPFEANSSCTGNGNSPDSSIEKHDHPSPVSVLDSYLLEDVECPDFKNTGHSANSGEKPKPLIFSYAEAQLRALWADNGIRPDYIKTVFELSGLCAEDISDAWYFEDGLLDPFLYDVIPHPDNQTEDWKLLFDFISEGIRDIQSRRHLKFFFLQPVVQPLPTGKQIIFEVSRYVDKHLSSNQLACTLDQIISKDMADGSWTDHRLEIESLALDIEHFVIDELIEEAVFELWL